MLRIVSYNIRHGLGMDGRIDLERVAEVISKAKPDLAAIQEVDRFCERSGRRDTASELGRLLNMTYKFGRSMALGDGDYGVAILSKLPILETIRHPLPEGDEPRCALEVRVRIEELASPISFVCVHNDWISPEVRVQQIKALLGILCKKDNPTILAGDFNAERTDESLRILDANQWRILDKKGKKTFPSDIPEIEIDFFAIRNFPKHSVKHNVIDDRLASDHRPIYAEIDFPDAK